jgi:hypothetical protein
MSNEFVVTEGRRQELSIRERLEPQNLDLRFKQICPGFRTIARSAGVCAVLLFLAGVVAAQAEDVTIEVRPDSSSVHIEVSARSQTSWSFRDAYAGVVGLGRRVRNFQVRDTPGARNSVREVAPGHFELGAPASSVRYEIDLSPPARASEAAFVSWLTKERGVLHLGDLLPLSTRPPGNALQPVFVTTEMPEGWEAYANEETAAMRARGLAAAADGVIIMGKNLRRSERTVSGKSFTVLMEATWSFSDQEALDTLTKVIQLHGDVGAVPCQRVTLLLSTFPSVAAAANTWAAETRGCTVTLLMGQTPSRVGALAQLGNALTHETFHLWIPNGVALGGEYDWFYEGFTMYQAARAAVKLGMVTWPEFLNAIARAHDASNAVTGAQPLSLIDASKQRWTTGAASVYSKAMVVAFLYDLRVRQHSGGKRSLEDVYRSLLRDHLRRSAEKKLDSDGSAAAMAAMRSQLSSESFNEQFISGPVSIDLKKELAPFGLRVEKVVRTHISVSDDATKRQRDLLKQLGYNEPRRR